MSMPCVVALSPAIWAVWLNNLREREEEMGSERILRCAWGGYIDMRVIENPEAMSYNHQASGQDWEGLRTFETMKLKLSNDVGGYLLT